MPRCVAISQDLAKFEGLPTSLDLVPSLLDQQPKQQTSIGLAFAIPNFRGLQTHGRTTMAESAARIVLWLFVINLGIAFGAGLYEGRVVVPQWLGATPDSGYRWNAGVAR